MATEIKFNPIPLEIQRETPTTGTILIVPYAPELLRDKTDAKYRWGGIKRSGCFTIKGKPIEGWNYMGNNLTIDGAGLSLNMANESHRNLYMIIRYADQFKGVVSEVKEKRYPNSKFYFQNNELEIQKYLAAMREGDELVDRIRALNSEQINRLGLWFGIQGSDDFKKGSLRKMTEEESTRKKLQEVLMNPDREVMELVAVAETKGNSSLKEGLWKNLQSGIYYWNGEAIGVGRDSVIVYLKKNVVLQNEMRKLYFTIPAQETVEPVQHGEKIVNPVQIKVSTGVTWTIDELVAEYKKGEKTFYQLGEMFKNEKGHGTHHLTIKKMLKEANAL